MNPESEATDTETTERCRETALRLLSQRAHSRAELVRKLQTRGVAAAVIATVLDDLQRVQLVDDLVFAKAYCEERTTGARALGRMRVAMELRRRGVPGDVANQALAETSADDDGTAELEHALEAGRRKWRSVRGQPGDRAAQAKVYRFLASRGFSGDVCRRVLDRLGDVDPAE